MARQSYSAGKRHPEAKLTERDVIALRTGLKKGTLTLEAFAEQKDISRPSAWCAAVGQTWKHVPGALPFVSRPARVPAKYRTGSKHLRVGRFSRTAKEFIQNEKAQHWETEAMVLDRLITELCSLRRKVRK